MKLLRRFATVLQGSLAPAADPRAAGATPPPDNDRLDRLGAALAALSEARGRIERRLAWLHERQAAYWQAAAAALQAGDESAARRSLVWRKAEQPALAQAAAELAALVAEEQRLREARLRLAAELDAERARREATEAQRLAAEARAGAYAALASLDEPPTADAGAAAAERRALDARARADALAELAERRDRSTWPGERQQLPPLDAAAQAELEHELAVLKSSGQRGA